MGPVIIVEQVVEEYGPEMVTIVEEAGAELGEVAAEAEVVIEREGKQVYDATVLSLAAAAAAAQRLWDAVSSKPQTKPVSVTPCPPAPVLQAAPRNPSPLEASKYQPPPKNLPAFPGAKSTRPKTPITGGGGKLRKRWKDNDGNIYEWDYQHGKVEKYDPRGKHQGEFDPTTGEQTKPKDPGRKVEP